MVTHGKEANGVLEATRKIKATADFEDCARELGWSPPSMRKAVEFALKRAEEDRTEEIELYREALK